MPKAEFEKPMTYLAVEVNRSGLSYVGCSNSQEKIAPNLVTRQVVLSVRSNKVKIMIKWGLLKTSDVC